MSGPNFSLALGADGVSPALTGSFGVDASSSPFEVEWDDVLLANGDTVDLSGATAEILARPLRYIIIQPIGGAVDVLLGECLVGLRVLDGERYPVPSMLISTITLVDGPADVRIEVGL